MKKMDARLLMRLIEDAHHRSEGNKELAEADFMNRQYGYYKEFFPEATDEEIDKQMEQPPQPEPSLEERVAALEARLETT